MIRDDNDHDDNGTGVMIVIIRVMTTIIATSSASLLVPGKLSSSHPLHCQGCLTSLLISIYNKNWMVLGDDQMMIKMMTRVIAIIVASLASLTAVMRTIIAASSASPMLPDKR